MNSITASCSALLVWIVLTVSADCDFELRSASSLHRGFEKEVLKPIIVRDSTWRSKAASLEDGFSNMSVDVTRRLEFQSETGLKPDRTTTSFGTWKDELAHNTSAPFIFQFCHQTLPQGLCDARIEETGLPALMRRSSGRLYVSAGAESKAIALHSHEKTWSALATGSKVWYVAPPGQPAVKPYHHWEEDRLAAASLMRCTQNPGDIVYLPDEWWHATFNKGLWTFAIGGQLDSAGIAYEAARGDVESLRSKNISGKKKALRVAAIHGHVDILEVLLEKNIDMSSNVGTQAHKGAKAVHFAAVSGHVPVLSWLSSKGARLSAQDNGGRTAGHYAGFAGHASVLQWLLESGQEDVTIRDDQGKTVTHHAASNGHVELLELLSAADLADADSDGAHAVHQAALAGHVSVVQYLGTKGIDASTQDSKGRSIAHHAVVGGHVAVLELLHAAGADMSAKDQAQLTVAASAALQGHGEVLDLLLSKGIDDIFAPDKKGLTAVHRAAVKGQAEVLEVLALHRADISGTDNAHGMSPLLFAASVGHGAVVELLVDKNADASVADASGISAGHYAANKGHAPVLQTLLSKGLIDLAAKDKHGSTVASVAKKAGHAPILDLLASAQGDGAMAKSEL